MKVTLKVLLFLLVAGLAFESFADEKALLKTPYIEFSEAQLKKGRKIWLENCESCHAYGIGDAPIPMEPDEWKDRVTKDKSVLYDHAINGFFGEDDAMMPERGGNLELDDEEVKAAVDYMVALASYYINKPTK